MVEAPDRFELERVLTWAGFSQFRRVSGQLGIVLIREPHLAAAPSALEITKIDIVEHCKTAVTPAEATTCFHDFLKINFGEELKSKEKIALVGHNVNFDVGFLRRLYRFTAFRFDEMFSHRMMDTASLVRFLILAGKLPHSFEGRR